MNIPEGHQAIMPYLMLRNAPDFIRFCKDVFGAELNYIAHRDESRAIIMHAELDISGGTVMFCDATEDWPPQTANMFVYVSDADKTFRLAVNSGAAVIQEPADKEYGRSCGVTDPFGNTWWITSVAD
ncbi:MAG: VOC family protein [Bacteroidia bacterium]|nr:VOC family protein [Bacteroidia bacterium]